MYISDHIVPFMFTIVKLVAFILRLVAVNSFYATARVLIFP